MKVKTKAVITSNVIASTVIAATRACLPHGTPIIVIDDKTGPIPEGLIPFDVSIEDRSRMLDLSKNRQYLNHERERLSENECKCAKFFRIS